MIFDITSLVLIAALAAFSIVMYLKYTKILDKLGKLALKESDLVLKVSELEDLVTRVEEKTGQTIYRLDTKFKQFEQEFGDAAIEEKREAARAEKAWADGLNSIMSYGANLHGGGNK